MSDAAYPVAVAWVPVAPAHSSTGTAETAALSSADLSDSAATADARAPLVRLLRLARAARPRRRAHPRRALAIPPVSLLSELDDGASVDPCVRRFRLELTLATLQGPAGC